MSRIDKLICKYILEIGLMLILCLISMGFLNKDNYSDVIQHGNYTNVEVKNINSVLSVNDFSKTEQVILNIYNDSNTEEFYNVYLTSKSDLNLVEKYLKIKINDNEYLLSDLKVGNNCYLLDNGDIVSGVKELKLFFAVNKEQIDLVKELSFDFYTDSIIV